MTLGRGNQSRRKLLKKKQTVNAVKLSRQKNEQRGKNRKNVKQQKNSNSKTQRQQETARGHIHRMLGSWYVKANAPKNKTSKNIEKILKCLLT